MIRSTLLNQLETERLKEQRSELRSGSAPASRALQLFETKRERIMTVVALIDSFVFLILVLASATPLWRRRVSVFAGAVAIATAVGITRLYLGAHWLTDVLAGWALGTVWLLVVAAVSQAAARRPVSPALPER